VKEKNFIEIVDDNLLVVIENFDIYINIELLKKQSKIFVQ